MAPKLQGILAWTLTHQLMLALVLLLGSCLLVRADYGEEKVKRTTDYAKSRNVSIEKNLIQTLLDEYKRIGIVGRPVERKDVKISVEYGLALAQILDLDENKQILRTNCWSRYRWKDDLLRWNPEDYGNISQIRVFPDQLWTPDIKLYNYADERLQEHRVARVVVYSNGQLIWIPQALFKSTCPVTILHFPFDRQICELEFGSWSYDIEQLEINFWIPDIGPQSPSPYIDLATYTSSNEWNVDGEIERDMNHTDRKIQAKACKSARVIPFTLSNGTIITKRYRTLRYFLKISRNPSFYVSILIIPCVLLSSLTLVVFWLPPESSAKMMLGMNIFVAFFILLLLLRESTPSAVRDFPLIGSYYCMNMVMITLSTFIAVTIINLYFRGDKKGPVPVILRRIVIEGLGRLLLVRQDIPLVDEDKLKKLLQTANPSPCHHGKSRMIPHMRYNKFLNEDPAFPRHGVDLSIEDSPLLGGYGMSSLEWEVHEVKKYIRSYVTKQKDSQRSNFVAMEWRTLALVFDRLFFFIYVLIMTIALIVLIPRRPEQLSASYCTFDNK